MTALRAVKDEIERIGYSTIVKDYVFSDVFSAQSVSRTAVMVAFTHSPPSYRTAAFAVVHSESRSAEDIVREYRALGAPLLFVIETKSVAVWQVRTESGSHPIATVREDQLGELFEKNREAWNPLSIQRAKSIGQFKREYQLDFVDAGLVPAIEGELHLKLDRLLSEALAEVVDGRGGQAKIEEHSLFRALFRFLAAKILEDRGHEISTGWDVSRVETVLDTIASYYNLPSLPIRRTGAEYKLLSRIWEKIHGGINFQNISSDDLAFVYENTLVTADIRKRFGTHSTPRQVAEYVVSNLGLHNHDPRALRVYEPFAGSGVFLVAALRQLREQLPLEWTDRRRHDELVKRISGDEIDVFACEVAMLSLILADYPNKNGWHLRNVNLFEDGVLDSQLGAHNVILCNPPFEAFTDEDRRRHSITQRYAYPPVAVLAAALNAKPLAIGFVLPRPFILERQFSEQRRQIERLYESIELVELPDRIFRVSKTESALLIAHGLRSPTTRSIGIRSTHVADRDREQFLRTGQTTTVREVTRTSDEAVDGELWIPPLNEVWKYLKPNPKLGDKVEIHRGIEWNYEQDLAWSSSSKAGYQEGLQTSRGASQYALPSPVWLDCRQNKLRGRAIEFPWAKSKLIVNAGRLSRGPWRLAAALDKSGLVCSQQFFGLWPRDGEDMGDLTVLLAILNGPVANAFIALHSPQKGIRISAMNCIPLPRSTHPKLHGAVIEYSRMLRQESLRLTPSVLQEKLNAIDAMVLQAYDLPPQFERQLLDFFRGAERPVTHNWEHWLPVGFKPFIPLHRYLSNEYKVATSGRILDVFKPLPDNEAAAIRKYMD